MTSPANMAASSPSPSSNGLSATTTLPKNLRGLNKPKCIQCGNVARSRCPFQSCKGCCSKAENPCPIHVLKAAAGSAEKTQTQSTPASDHKSYEGTSGSTIRSIRHLSSNFSQFNNLKSHIRPRKPLTIKDALALNEWRFAKLKEYKDRLIEVENEAFDRYMKNVSLLEEVFTLTPIPEELIDSATTQNDDDRTISDLKLRLRSNPARTESFKEWIRTVVNEGLVKLKRTEGDEDEEEPERRVKREKWEKKSSALNEIIDKLNKARTEEDVKSCKEMKSKIYHHHRHHRHHTFSVENSDDELGEKNKDLRGFVRRIEIDEETIRRIDEEICCMEQIGGL